MVIKSALRRVPGLVRAVKAMRNTPERTFQGFPQWRINHRRLEHLASLRLPLHDVSVLEVGAGIGELTGFFVDRNCRVTSVDGRPGNLRILKDRYSGVECRVLDSDDPDPTLSSEFDVVFCYGLLYHLRKPGEAIEYMAARCRRFLLIETCVSFGDGELLNLCAEDAGSPSQALSGWGCRPTRSWIYSRLKGQFEYVYMPITQPCHDDYPTDWERPPAPNSSGLIRAVFIASRLRLSDDHLVEELPLKQQRC